MSLGEKVNIIIFASILIVASSAVGFIFTFADSDELSIVKEVHNKTDPFDPDTDSDGLTDGTEVTVYSTNPTSKDTDGDGLNDREELKKYSTNPTHKDTDQDGLTDGKEIEKYETDPNKRDTDSDGLSDWNELNQYNTNPVSSDTDSDGLSDGKEINTYNTDPTDDDSDTDGLSDGEEINNYNTDPTNDDSDSDKINDFEEIHTYKTDPNKKDTDSDGLSDWNELNQYNTNPTEEDTDNDGLLDNEEVNTYNTNPTEEDTDNDGLLDNEEVNTYNTNPTEEDTDNDGVSDSTELQLGTNPKSKPDCLDTANSNIDSDYDRVNNRKECLYGLDKNDSDTDSDGLSDWEELHSETYDGTSLNESNPKMKDIYIVVGLSEGTMLDVNRLEGYLENAEIENANDKTGLNIHITTVRLDETEVFRSGSFDQLRSEYKSRLTKKSEVHRGVLITQSHSNNNYAGYAEAPGKFAVVDSGFEIVAYHEILHMIVGDIPNECEGEGHVCSEEGVLNPAPQAISLSGPTIEHIHNYGLDGIN